MTEQQFAELQDRISRLEAGARPRGRTNTTGAARYLGKSTMTLARWHAAGRGPRRTLISTRGDGKPFWSYSYDDLDAFPEINESTPAETK